MAVDFGLWLLIVGGGCCICVVAFEFLLWLLLLGCSFCMWVVAIAFVLEMQFVRHDSAVILWTSANTYISINNYFLVYTFPWEMKVASNICLIFSAYTDISFFMIYTLTYFPFIPIIPG